MNGKSLTLVSASGGFMDVQTLPTTGAYTVTVDPQQAATGSVTLRLHAVPPDPAGSIAPGGGPVTVTTTTPGQNASLTFTATAGQRVSLLATGVTALATKVTLNGKSVTLVSASGGFIDTQALPTNGTYTIAIDPQQAATGSLTLTLYDVTDLSGSIAPGGPPVTATFTMPGQNGAWTFSGTAGQSVTLKVSAVSVSVSKVSITGPTGANVLAPTTVTSVGKTVMVTLAATGTHTVVVDPSGTYTGSVTLTLT